MKRPVPLYDFKAFGAAKKAARNASDKLYISPRCLANIENSRKENRRIIYADI